MHQATLLSTLLPSYLPHEDLTGPLSVLASNGLSTDVDLVFGPRSLPPHPALSPQLYSLLRSFASSNLSAPSTSATVTYSRLPTPRNLSTSLPSLDNLLGYSKGFVEGDLVEVVGTPSSGRTVLALYASLSYLLLNPTRRAAYLDTTGTFDPFRCLSILKQILIPRLREGGTREGGTTFSSPMEDQLNTEEQGKPKEMTDDQIAMSALDRISVSRITKSGQALDKIVDDQSKEEGTRLGVVVIDQVDHLLGGDALSTSKSAQGHANLIAFTRRLSSLAKSTTSPLTLFLINSLIPCPSPSSNSSKSSAIRLVPSNPQPPPITSLPLLSAVAPHGLVNALNPPSSESWSNLTDLSLVCIKSEDVFSTRGGGEETDLRVRGGGGPTPSARRRELVALVEVGKNSRGVGGTGQLIGIKLENGIKLSEI